MVYAEPSVFAPIDVTGSNSLLVQVGFHLIRDIAFGDAAQINPGIGILQSHCVAVNLNLPVIHCGKSRLNVRVGGDHGGIGLIKQRFG